MALAGCLIGLLGFPAMAGGELAVPAAPQVPHVSLPPQVPTPGPVNNAVGQVNGAIDRANGSAGNAGGYAGGIVNHYTGSPSNGPSGGGGNSSPGGTVGGGGGGGNGSNTGSGGNGGGGNGGGNALTLTPGGGAAAGGPGAAAARRAAARRAARRALRVNATRAADTSSGSAGGGSGPLRTIIKVIPGWLWAVIGVLAVLTVVFFGRAWFDRRRARRLEREREELERHRKQLLGDVGLLQNALLPEVPTRIGPLEASVAYRPAEGPAAGGDFYDVFEMERDRVAIIVGDVCGHGRQALAITALMRYSLRAYLQAGGGDPRTALQIAARALENEPHAELTTVVLAVYDAREGTLTYACAGHEPPILLGAPAHKPVTVGASPPIGAGTETGLRETCVPLPPGAMACFFTDGLVEARLGDGLLGRKRLAELAKELRPHGSADELLTRIAERTDRAPDDMAACIIRATEDAPAARAPRIEDLELDGVPGEEERARAFLEACGMPKSKRDATLRTARTTVGEFGGAILRVRLENGRGVSEVVPHEPSVTIGLNGGEVGQGAAAASRAV